MRPSILFLLHGLSASYFAVAASGHSAVQSTPSSGLEVCPDGDCTPLPEIDKAHILEPSPRPQNKHAAQSHAKAIKPSSAKSHEILRKGRLKPHKPTQMQEQNPKHSTTTITHFSTSKDHPPRTTVSHSPQPSPTNKPKTHPHPDSAKSEAVGYPFKRVVAFGDNLSDNGNGSYAHHVASIGQPNNTIYGFRTWTDGPVAVSYLVDMLGVPLAIDYAFGGAQGGSKLGATINSSYTYSEYAPDGFTQVHNYTSTSGYTPAEVASTLHFVWIGNNDINLLHLSTASRNNSLFAEQMSRQMTELVGRLIGFGAQHVFVPGLYAKQLSPSWRFYARNTRQRRLLGRAIRQANAAIKSELERHFPSKVIYYDVYGRMMHLWNNHSAYGIKYVGDNFCDGHSQEDWNICVTQHKGDEFYWMQYLDMTSHVDLLIAKDMHRVLAKRFGVL